MSILSKLEALGEKLNAAEIAVFDIEFEMHQERNAIIRAWLAEHPEFGIGQKTTARINGAPGRKAQEVEATITSHSLSGKKIVAVVSYQHSPDKTKIQVRTVGTVED
jgi:predicted Zn-dependent protease